MNGNSNVSILQSDRAARTVVSRTVAFVRRHYLISSFYVAGLLLAALASGWEVDGETREYFDTKMSRASELTDTDMLVSFSRLKQAEDVYYASKGWFTCDKLCTNNYQKVVASRAHLDSVKARRALHQAEAKMKVGVWSTIGVTELRRAFWAAWEDGKEAARRMTMFDAIFIGLNAVSGSNSRDRDDSFLLSLLQIGVQFLLNLTIGLVASLFAFVIEAYSIITSYGPSFLSGLSAFVLAIITALSLVVTAIGSVAGGLVGGLYLVVRSAEKRARLGDNQRRGRLHLD